MKEMEEKRVKSLEALVSKEDVMGADEFLKSNAKKREKASIQWKYEYKRQQNLLKKRIQISRLKVEDEIDRDRDSSFPSNWILRNSKTKKADQVDIKQIKESPQH